MPRLSELLSDTADAVVSFPSADVHITYRPSVYTRQFEAELEQLDFTSTDTESTRDKCDELLSRLIVNWDLTDEEDEEIPLKRGEIAAKVPFVFLVLFVQKLLEAVAGEVAAGRKTTTQMPTPLPTNRVERRIAARKR